METKPLTHRAQLFVAELLANPHMNQTQAALNAGFAPRSAHTTGSDLMKDPRVIKALEGRSAEVLEKLAMTHADVLLDLMRIATADQNDLTQYRIGACRYCHGDEHRYQRTPAEYRSDLTVYISHEQYRKLRQGPDERDVLGLLFALEGGTGYDPRKDPHPDCPECFGEGVGREIIRDTRTLAPAARRLYAGIKRTKNGIEVMTRSQDKALEMAARHTGVIKAALEVTGKNGGPLQHAGAVVALTTTDPIEAAREYQKLMGE